MILFSLGSIFDYIDHLRAGNAPLTADGTVGLWTKRVTAQSHVCFVQAGDSHDGTIICVDERAVEHFGADPRILERLLQRVHRVARELGTPPLSLPLSWRKYQADNRIAFFALPRGLNPQSLRWISSKLDDDLVVFWELTAPGGEKNLASYVPDPGRLKEVRRAWRDAVSYAASPGEGMPREKSLRDKVDLEVVGASAIGRERPYTQWLKHLDKRQEMVLAYGGEQSLKVRGIAGTGKTLTLQLKALKEVYAAADAGKEIRVLYLTHSWALADLVDSSLRAIDERGLAVRISVWPLAWARDYLYGSLPEGVEVLGEDGLEGKKLQLDLVSAILDVFESTDWPTYRDLYAVSEFVVGGIEKASSESRLALCWMLIREFAEVMDAYQIKPSRNALEKYLGIARADWMVQLETDGDKRVFYAVFQRFVARLVEEGQMTTDQTFDDFRGYLESYAWNLRRATEGFDMILVDEFHLFSDSERYLLHLLTRDPDEPPRMILALDPRQSPFMLLTGLKESPVSRQLGGADGEVESVDLRQVHRFSAGILRFVQTIQRRHPAILDEGDDWMVSLDSVTSKSQGGERLPALVTYPTADQATQAAVDAACTLHTEASGAERVALIAAGGSEFDSILSVLERANERRFVVLNSRDEIDQLNYVKKSVVLATGADCAGLQFTHVVVLVFAGLEASHGRGTSATRAALTDLYLSVSRAERVLEVVTDQGEGTIPELLEHAVEEGVLRSKNEGTTPSRYRFNQH